MNKRDRISILRSHEWDVICTLDGLYSAEKGGVILKDQAIEALYKSCKQYDLKNILYKVEEGIELVGWERLLLIKNKKYILSFS